METIILYVKGMFTVVLLEYRNNYIICKGMCPVSLVEYGNNYILCKGNVSSGISRIWKQLYYI